MKLPFVSRRKHEEKIKALKERSSKILSDKLFLRRELEKAHSRLPEISGHPGDMDSSFNPRVSIGLTLSPITVREAYERGWLDDLCKRTLDQMTEQLYHVIVNDIVKRSRL